MEEEVKEEGSGGEDEGGVEAVFEETLKARYVDEDDEVFCSDFLVQVVEFVDTLFLKPTEL